MMTLNEKLNVISDLEAERLSEELIESILEHIENPEPIAKRYNSFKEMLDDMENDEDWICIAYLTQQNSRSL